MLLASVALAAAVLSTALAVPLYFEWVRLGRSARPVRNGLVRTEAWRGEARRIRAWRAPVADATEAVNDAIQLGATVARVGHGAIAAVSFSVFGAFPRTRQKAIEAQEAHDAFSDRLYRRIELTGDGLTDATRRALLGEERPPESSS